MDKTIKEIRDEIHAIIADFDHFGSRTDENWVEFWNCVTRLRDLEERIDGTISGHSRP
jgi:hypothetical protein